jgi:hypothetical protein
MDDRMNERTNECPQHCNLFYESDVRTSDESPRWDVTTCNLLFICYSCNNL